MVESILFEVTIFLFIVKLQRHPQLLGTEVQINKLNLDTKTKDIQGELRHVQMMSVSSICHLRMPETYQDPWVTSDANICLYLVTRIACYIHDMRQSCI